MQLAWLTDLHVNLASRERIDRLRLEIAASRPEGLLIGGDVADGPAFVSELRAWAEAFRLPVYFVLGNHDYYQWSVAGAREAARRLCRDNPRLVWLSEAGVIRLSGRTALVGHDGWGDARAASLADSTVILNDYLLIEELRAATFLGARRQWQPGHSAELILTSRLEAKLHELGEEAAEHFGRVLPEALDWADHVLVLMHVPPFREACWHHGRTADDNWAPHFTCLAAGEALRAQMQHHPHRRMTVLCGHTHSDGRARILPNLEVITGGAEYGDPRLQALIGVE